MEEHADAYTLQPEVPDLLTGAAQISMDAELGESPPCTPKTDGVGRQHSMSSLSSVGPLNYQNSPSVSTSLQCGSVTYDNVLTGSTTSLANNLGSHGAVFPGGHGKSPHAAGAVTTSPADVQTVTSLSSAHTKDTTWPSATLSDKFFTPYENSAFAGERPQDDRFFTPLNTVLASKAQRTPFTTRLERVTDTSTGEAGSGRPTGSGTSFDPLAGCDTTWGSAPSSSSTSASGGPADNSESDSACSQQHGRASYAASTARSTASADDAGAADGFLAPGKQPEGEHNSGVAVAGATVQAPQSAYLDQLVHQADTPAAGDAPNAFVMMPDNLVCHTVLSEMLCGMVGATSNDGETPVHQLRAVKRAVPPEIGESCCLVASPPQNLQQGVAQVAASPANDKAAPCNMHVPANSSDGPSREGGEPAMMAEPFADLQLHATLASAVGAGTPYLLKRLHAPVTPLGQGRGSDIASPGFGDGHTVMLHITTAACQEEHLARPHLHLANSQVNSASSKEITGIPAVSGLGAMPNHDNLAPAKDKQFAAEAAARGQQTNCRSSQTSAGRSSMGRATAKAAMSQSSELAAARSAVPRSRVATPPTADAAKAGPGSTISAHRHGAGAAAAPKTSVRKHSTAVPPKAAEGGMLRAPSSTGKKPSGQLRAGCAATLAAAAAAPPLSSGASTARPATAQHHEAREEYHNTGAATARRPSTAAAATRPSVQPAKAWASSNRPATAAPIVTYNKLPKSTAIASGLGTAVTDLAWKTVRKSGTPPMAATKAPPTRAASAVTDNAGTTPAAAAHGQPASTLSQVPEAAVAVQQGTARPFIPKLNLLKLPTAGAVSTPDAVLAKLCSSARAGNSTATASSTIAATRLPLQSTGKCAPKGSPITQPASVLSTRHPQNTKAAPLVHQGKTVTPAKGATTRMPAGHVGAVTTVTRHMAPPSARIVATPRNPARAAGATPNTARPATTAQAHSAAAARRRSAGSASAAGLRELESATSAAVRVSSSNSRLNCPTASSKAKCHAHVATSHDALSAANELGTATPDAPGCGAGSAGGSHMMAGLPPGTRVVATLQLKGHQAAAAASHRRASDVPRPPVQSGTNRDTRRLSATGIVSSAEHAMSATRKAAAALATSNTISTNARGQQCHQREGSALKQAAGVVGSVLSPATAAPRAHAHVELREGARQLDAAAAAAKERLNRRNAFHAPSLPSHKLKKAPGSGHAAPATARGGGRYGGSSKDNKQAMACVARSSGSNADYNSQTGTRVVVSGQQQPATAPATRSGLRSTHSTESGCDTHGLGSPLTAQMDVPIVICTPRTSGAGSAARPHRYSCDCEDNNITQGTAAAETASAVVRAAGPAAAIKPLIAAASTHGQQGGTPGNRVPAMPSAASPAGFHTGFQLWRTDVSQETPTLLNSARTRGRTPLTRKVRPPPTAAAVVSGPVVHAGAAAVACTNGTAAAAVAVAAASGGSASADTSAALKGSHRPGKLDWSALWAVTPTSSFRTDLGDPSPRSETLAPAATSITSDMSAAGMSRSQSPAGSISTAVAAAVPPRLPAQKCSSSSAAAGKELGRPLSAPLLVVSETLVHQGHSPSSTGRTSSPPVCMSPGSQTPGSSNSPVWTAVSTETSTTLGQKGHVSTKPAWGAACMLSTVGRPTAKEGLVAHSVPEAAAVVASQVNPLRLSMFEVQH